MPKLLREFFAPHMSRAFLVRAAILAAATFAIGRWAIRPMVVQGASMEPTYSSRGFNFGNLLAYRSHPPRRGDVVLLRYGGERWYLLKRVIAFAGETVEFINGVCLVDGQAIDEPYVKLNAGWTVPPRKVSPGHVYVMGDNRSVPFEAHVGGEIAVSRIAGRPLW
jgi:signal peptidase I